MNTAFWWRRWLNRCRATLLGQDQRRPFLRTRLRVEILEDRTVPSTLVVTSNGDAGAGTLRQALSDAANGDVIDFSPLLTGQTITLRSELLVSKDLTISGPGAGLLAVSGNHASRIFEIQGAVNVAILGLTLSGGSIFSGNGAAIDNPLGALTVRGCVLSNNGFFLGSSGPSGGAIANGSGSLLIDASTLSNNDITGPFGSDSGGAIFTDGGTAVIENSLFSNNHAGTGQDGIAAGGAIFNNASNLTLFACTFASNTVSIGKAGNATGGALFNNTGTALITNCTFTANGAGGTQSVASGGAIANSTGQVTVHNSTIATNKAMSSGIVARGGGIDAGGGSFTLQNTIVAGNQVSGNTTQGPDISGTITSQGNNLIQNTSGATINGDTASNIIGQDPLLGPLQNNGGPTPTMYLLSGSPAINHGNFTGFPLTDQRGFSRVVDGVMDIGAVETSSLNGRVFQDFNGDGLENGPDTGLGGVTITLLDANTSQVIATTTSDSNGNYAFGKLAAGTYRVRATAPAGYSQSTANPADVTYDGTTNVIVPPFGLFHPSPSVSVAFGPFGEVLEIVSLNGTLTQYSAFGAQTLATGVRSASVAFDGSGSEVILMTRLDGTLTLFDKFGSHLLAIGVFDASVAFGPQGEVIEMVRLDGSLTQYDATGAHVLGNGVLSASVPFGPSGEVVEVVRPDGSLTQYDSTGAHLLGFNVLSAGVAFGPSGEVLDVVFADNELFQFDATGQHRLGVIS